MAATFFIWFQPCRRQMSRGPCPRKPEQRWAHRQLRPAVDYRFVWPEKHNSTTTDTHSIDATGWNCDPRQFWSGLDRADYVLWMDVRFIFERRIKTTKKQRETMERNRCILTISTWRILILSGYLKCENKTRFRWNYYKLYIETMSEW